MVYSQDTIVAQATAIGEGAVAIVRLSGPESGRIADSFVRVKGAQSVADIEPRLMAGATMMAGDDVIDQGLLVRFQAPRSFTGEDIVELHLHGNPLIVDLVLQRAVAAGARMAEAGEFTRRAFLNGKMDLTQAEALADVIRAESDQALIFAQRQMLGEMRGRLETFRQRVIDALARVELELDFVEDGYQFASREEIHALIADLRSFADELVGSHRAADRLRRGPRILLYGRPNAGKSSLFNAFLGYNRALVSPVAGTTRDYLEERITYRGLTLHFLDSAGVRSAEDALEAEGVSRAQTLIELVDTVLYLIDLGSSKSLIASELGELDRLRSTFSRTSFICVWTKSDIDIEVEECQREGDLAVSIYDSSSILNLLDRVAAEFTMDISSGLLLFSQRQLQILRQMSALLASIDPDAQTELLSADLRELLHPLSQLTGSSTNDDVLNAIFSSFCIGK